MQSKSKYTFRIQKLFPKIASFMRWRRKTWRRVRGHKWRYNMAHTRCMLEKQGYMHTRPGARTYTQICNIHIDLHRNNDSRTRLNVTLNVHCLCFRLSWDRTLFTVSDKYGPCRSSSCGSSPSSDCGGAGSISGKSTACEICVGRSSTGTGFYWSISCCCYISIT
jgi:hypothetical protein